MATAAAEASHDVAAVEQAAFELMEIELARECKDALRRRLGAGCTDEALAGYDVQRTVPDGFYIWTGHLFMLAAALTAGISLRATDIKASEMAGLGALRRARSRFSAAHPDCSRCGMPLMDRHGACAICGSEQK
jgi:hypothetical protein